MPRTPTTSLDGRSTLLVERPSITPGIAIAAVADCLTQLIPADLVACNEVDLDLQHGDVWTASPGLRPDQHALEQMFETIADNPMVQSYVRSARTGDLAPRRMSDLVSDRAFRRTRSYSSVFRPHSGQHQLTVLSVRYAGQRGRVWGFNRASSDFTDAEVERLEMVQPFLAIIDQLIERPIVAQTQSDAADRWGLTRREAEVVGLLARGLTADAIASSCQISDRTVRQHLQNAYLKLGCHDKVTAVLRLRGEA